MIEVNEKHESGEDDNFGLSARKKCEAKTKTRFVNCSEASLRNSRAALSLSAQKKFRSRKTVSKYYIYY